MIIKSVKDVLARRPLAQVPPKAPVRRACEVLEANDFGALAVMDGETLVGVFSERDVIRRVVCRDLTPRETTVGEVMTREPFTIALDASLADAMALMTARGFRHLPVIEGQRVVGMLSFRDIPAEYRVMLERYTDYRGAPRERHRPAG